MTIERQQRHAIATVPGRVVDVAVYRPCAAPANFYAFEYISAWTLLARTKGGKITKRIHLLVSYRFAAARLSFLLFLWTRSFLDTRIEKKENSRGSNSRDENNIDGNGVADRLIVSTVSL